MNKHIDFDLLDTEVKAHKEEAKLLRDEGDYPGAIEELARAIQLIDDSGWDEGLVSASDASGERKRIAFQLADCLGMNGGNYRRLNRLQEALSCFERGRRIEEDPRFAVKSSYNLVNALIVPLEEGRKTSKQQRDVAMSAISTLERQVSAAGNRRSDRWAWADLGECRLVVGDHEGAQVAYREFLRLGDEDSRQSALKVLRRLQNALEKAGDDSARSVRLGIEWLEKPSSDSSITV